MKHKLLSILLSLVMVLSLLPTAALADGKSNLPSYLTTQDTGLYIAGQKITGTGTTYYLLTQPTEIKQTAIITLR